ncbi:MAG: chemotaxis protein CheW [Bacteroides sp.]
MEEIMGELKVIDNNEAGETAVQYIVVKIGNEQYGINIQYIDNIVKNQRITRVPKTQKYYKGVINLRGEIIPVMSIRIKLGLEADEYTDKTRIIIIKVENATIGIIVDQVNEVITLQEEDVEKVSHEKSDDANGYICGIGKSKGELVSLLDIVSLIAEKEN